MKIARHILRTLPFIALLIWALVAEAGNETPVPVDKVRAFRDGEVFSAEFQTSMPWAGSDVQVSYLTEAIQVDFSGAFLNKGKQLIKVDDRVFKSFYATQLDASTVRARFSLKQGTSGKSFDGRFHARRNGSGITFEVVGDAVPGKSVKGVNDEARSVAVTDEDPANDAMPAKLVAGLVPVVAASGDVSKEESAQVVAVSAGGAADAPAVAEKKVDTNKLPESQIPVLTTTKDVKKSEGNQLYKVVLTLGVLATALGAAVLGLRRWSSKQSKKLQHTQIKVLTSHHLGPKKNLTIIQVAGETLLIGVTDQNITMLKTLSLLDDEIPNAVPQRFDQSMNDFVGDHEDDIEDEPIAMRGLSEIRDTVSARLKNMRNF